MSIIRKTLKLKKEDFYKKHLLIINHILPVQMTNKEAEVLACFMSLEGDLANDPFSTSGRKIVMRKLNIKPGGLGNYLDAFKRKGFVLENKTSKDLRIIPILIPNKETQLYQFKLEVDE